MDAPVAKTLGLTFENVPADNSLLLPIVQLPSIPALSGTVHASQNNDHSIVSLQRTGKLILHSADKRVGAGTKQLMHGYLCRPPIEI